jgi:hypothetical protein
MSPCAVVAPQYVDFRGPPLVDSLSIWVQQVYYANPARSSGSAIDSDCGCRIGGTAAIAAIEIQPRLRSPRETLPHRLYPRCAMTATQHCRAGCTGDADHRATLPGRLHGDGNGPERIAPEGTARPSRPCVPEVKADGGSWGRPYLDSAGRGWRHCGHHRGLASQRGHR